MLRLLHNTKNVRSFIDSVCKNEQIALYNLAKQASLLSFNCFVYVLSILKQFQAILGLLASQITHTLPEMKQSRLGKPISQQLQFTVSRRYSCVKRVVCIESVK